MGQILSANLIVKNNVNKFIENSTKDYAIYLNSAPTFATYYSKNLFYSTHDRAFEASNEIVGVESPIKFNTVKDFPLYSIQNASFSTDITDFGISGSVESGAIILPDTIKPMVDDCFTLFYNNVLRLYQVSNVEVDNYNNKTFYKISFFLSSFSLNDIEAQVNKTYHVDYKLIGKQEAPFTEEDKYNIYKDLETMHDVLLDEYINNFYDKNLHCLTFVKLSVLNMVSFSLSDASLNYFVNENSLLTYYNKFRQFNYITRDLLSEVRRSEYRKTMYYSMNMDPTELAANNLYKQIIVVPEAGVIHSNSWRLRTRYSSAVYKLDAYTPLLSETVYIPFSNDLLTRITANNIVGETNPYHSIIIKYFNSFYSSNASYSALIDDVNNMEDYDDNYYIIPVVLYILKKIIKQINSTQ